MEQKTTPGSKASSRQFRDKLLVGGAVTHSRWLHGQKPQPWRDTAAPRAPQRGYKLQLRATSNTPDTTSPSSPTGRTGPSCGQHPVRLDYWSRLPYYTIKSIFSCSFSCNSDNPSVRDCPSSDLDTRRPILYVPEPRGGTCITLFRTCTSFCVCSLPI